MGSKTKIIVLHMKEIIYTGIFLALGILLIILLVVMFRPAKEVPEKPQCTETVAFYNLSSFNN